MESADEFQYNYQKENHLLNMIAVPYLGVYSQNYTFLMPCNILHSNKISEKIYNNFPENLKSNYFEINNKYSLDIDYFLITLDGSYLCSKYSNNNPNGVLRLNYVPHPYIFYNVNSLEKDHVTNIYSCLYAHNGHENYLKETNEFDGMRINPEKFICDENKKEIILHKSDDNLPALSPNNCAFLINTNKVYFTIYNLTLVTYKNKIVKFMITQFNILLYNDIKLFSELFIGLNNFNSKDRESVSLFVNNLYNFSLNFKSIVKNIFGYYCSKDVGREEIKKIFNYIFRKDFHFEEENFLLLEEGNISQFYLDEIWFFIWHNMIRLNIPNLGENIFDCDKEYKLEILKKYLRSFLKEFDYFIDSYIVFISDIYENIQIKDEEVLIKNNLGKLIKYKFNLFR
jgi:hypothetical protein